MAEQGIDGNKLKLLIIVGDHGNIMNRDNGNKRESVIIIIYQWERMVINGTSG